jgi:DNA polymerase sigma
MVISFLQRHPKIAAGHIIAEDNLGAMLIEILELYGTRFNFDRVGIALDKGGFYFDKIKYERINPHIWKRICIRDPNDPNNNIAKASHKSENIIKVFGDSFRELTTRCYLLHAKIKAGETAPWGTKCGSILDAIIERPQHLIVRERLKGLWRENMSEVLQQLNSQPPFDSPTPKKSNRRERRAMDKRTKDGPREKRKSDKAKNDNATPAIIMPPRRRSPVTMKASTTFDSAGTRDMPILLDEFPSSPSSQFATRPPPLQAKKRKGPIDGVGSAAANLQATGSISGISRNSTN